MVRIDKVFKEKDYLKNSGGNFNSNRLSGLGEVNSILNLMSQAPIRSALLIVGLLVILYTTFKLTKKFDIIKENLKKI